MVALGFIVVDRNTLAPEHLPSTDRTPLDVATEAVQLAFYRTAVVARLTVGSPVVSLLAVRHSRIRDAIDLHRAHTLSRGEFGRPALIDELSPPLNLTCHWFALSEVWCDLENMTGLASDSYVG